MNGKTLSMDGGQACLDLDPATFPNNTRINLTAKAEEHTSRISLTLIRLATPLSGRLTGAGRAEAVEVRLDTAAGSAKDGLELRFDFAGRQGSPGSIRIPRTLGRFTGRLAGGLSGSIGR